MSGKGDAPKEVRPRFALRSITRSGASEMRNAPSLSRFPDPAPLHTTAPSLKIGNRWRRRRRRTRVASNAPNTRTASFMRRCSPGVMRGRAMIQIAIATPTTASGHQAYGAARISFVAPGRSAPNPLNSTANCRSDLRRVVRGVQRSPSLENRGDHEPGRARDGIAIQGVVFAARLVRRYGFGGAAINARRGSADRISSRD